MVKQTTSFRLSLEARELLKALAKDLGVSQADVVEIAIRMLDRTFSGKRIEPEE